LQDLGFLAFTLPQVEILMPTKRPPGAELPLAQQRANQVLNYRRLRIEHVNSSVIPMPESSDRWQSMENQPFPTLSVIGDRSELSGIGIT
jgi:hypothetical protein